MKHGRIHARKYGKGGGKRKKTTGKGGVSKSLLLWESDTPPFPVVVFRGKGARMSIQIKTHAVS